MARANTIQQAFTSGEVSPLIAGRTDTKVYANGLRTCENFIVKPQGALTFRSGTKFINATKFQNSATTAKARLHEFVYSDVEGYVLEFGDKYIRIHKDGHRLYNSNTNGEYTDDLNRANNGGLMQIRSANSDTDTPVWSITDVADSGGLYVITTGTVPHTYRTGVQVKIFGTGTTADTTWTITYVSPYRFSLQGSGAVVRTTASTGTVRSNGLLAGDELFLDGTGDLSTRLNGYHYANSVDSWFEVTLANVIHAAGTYNSERMVSIPIEVATDYTYDKLVELKFAQSADILYIFHPDFPVRKFFRSGVIADYRSWQIQDALFVDGPYLPVQNSAPTVDTSNLANGTNYPDVYLELSSYAHTGMVTSATGWAAGTPSADQNKYIEFRDGDQWRLAQLPAGLTAAATTATISILDNVLLHIDETTKFTGTFLRKFNTNLHEVTYDAGSPNASPSIPGAGVQQRVDPNNAMISDATTAGTGATAAGTLQSNYANTFGPADVGKYVRYFDNDSPPAPHWALITRVSRDGSGKGCSHSAAVAMAANNATGNFVVTAQSRTATIKSYKTGVVFALFASTDVGRHIRFGFAGRWTWGKITAYTSSSQVSVTFYEDVPRDPSNAANIAGALNGALTSASTTGRTYQWRLGAWSATTGYPSCGAFHEQRLISGRTNTQPQTFWGSVTGDFENNRPTELDSTVLDDNALDFTLASGRVNAIKWIESGTNLVIGTNGGEWLARSSSAIQQPITPTNISVTQQSRNGSSVFAMPLRIGSSIVFVDRSERYVMEVAYLYSEDRLADKDLTIVSEHIIRIGGVVLETAFQQNPDSIGWFLLSDGTLAALTYNKEQEVIAWHRHELGGTSATIESIAAIPSSDGTEDVIYMAVARTINGSVFRSIEYLTPQFIPTDVSYTVKAITAVANDGGGEYRITSNSHGYSEGTPVRIYGTGTTADGDWLAKDVTTNTFDLRASTFVTAAASGSVVQLESRIGQTFFDACKVISTNQLTQGAVIGGLDLMEGQTVGVTIDGVYETTHVVTAGSVTIASAPVFEVVVGLPYTATAKSLPLEGGSMHGTAQGMKKRLIEMKLRLWNSFNLNYGWQGALIAKDLTALTDVRSETSAPYFTGTVPLNPNNPHDLESPWTVTQTKPYPLTVLAFIGVVETTQ